MWLLADVDVGVTVLRGGGVCEADTATKEITNDG